MTVGRQPPLAPRGRRAFTLVELIVVMVLLLTVASLVAPRMASFFKGRALSGEAQRVLSLLHYARSQAAAEAVPVVVWFDPARSTYGVEPAPGFSGLGEVRRLEFTLEPSLRLEVALAGEEFQVWTLIVEGSSALLRCDDGNDRRLFEKQIEYTDFPEPGIKLYVADGVIMLPGEY